MACVPNCDTGAENVGKTTILKCLKRKSRKKAPGRVTRRGSDSTSGRAITDRSVSRSKTPTTRRPSESGPGASTTAGSSSSSQLGVRRGKIHTETHPQWMDENVSTDGIDLVTFALKGAVLKKDYGTFDHVSSCAIYEVYSFASLHGALASGCPFCD